MNFQVPQFIDIEDKIFGPFTFKQFLYLAGGIGLGYIFYAYLSFLPIIIKIIPALLSVGLGLALAFFKVNNQPFINIIEAGFWYVISSKLYLWRKIEGDTGREIKKENIIGTQSELPTLSQSKLKDLSWSLDVNEKVK